MIRALVLILALALGAAVAVATQVRMSHLRAWLPQHLPAWTEAIAPEAGLLAGRMRLDDLPPGTLLRWTWAAPGGDGLRWNAALTGPGIDLAGEVLVPFSLSNAWLRGARGTVTLEPLLPDTVALRGLIRVDSLSARAGLRTGWGQIRGEALAQVLDAFYQDVALGGGPLRAQLDPLGSWRLRLNLTGGAATAEALANGRRGQAMGGLSLTVQETETLPEGWRQILARLGKRDGTAWRIEQTMPWAALLRGAALAN